MTQKSNMEDFGHIILTWFTLNVGHIILAYYQTKYVPTQDLLRDSAI